MQVGIAVFAYNRSSHLQCVLDGLKSNETVDRLYIFQDGLQCEEHRNDWEKTRKVIENVTWCSTIVTRRNENIGLAASIVSGINKVLEENEAIIVLEDDCVPHSDFVLFMTKCFEKYRNERKVYSVSGYSWPGKIENESGSDNYFCGRISSWGWGTWKDRWQEYKQDYMLLNRIKKDKDASKRLAFWGDDLEEMLQQNLLGQINSWAVFWALTVIEKNGLCVNPYSSLIRNIGMDGTGIHSGTTNKYEVHLTENRQEDFVLSDKLECDVQVMNSFIFGNPIVQHAEYPDLRKRALIYGIGKSFEEHKKVLGKQYRIVALADRNKNGFIAGYRIIKPPEIIEYEYDYIIIMNKDIELSLHIAQQLIMEYQIKAELMRLGCILFEVEGMNGHQVLPNGTCVIKIGNVSLNISKRQELREVEQIFLREIYNYHMRKAEKEVIILLGSYSRILKQYFETRINIETIYELVPEQLDEFEKIVDQHRQVNLIVFFDWTYESTRFWDELDRHGIIEKIGLFVIRVEDTDTFHVFDTFHFNYIIYNLEETIKLYFAWR